MESSHPIKKFPFQNPCDANEEISQRWIQILGNNYETYTSEISKPDNDSLG
jgi:hypothetical protein